MTGTYADPATSDVTLTTNSTNAKYVQPTETGTLALDFTAFNLALDGDGLNPEARTYTAEGFRIRYDGDTAVTVWITSDAERVTFLARGTPAPATASSLPTNWSPGTTSG